ncbi:MAG TPA: 2-hydroxyacid dehydrogenase [Burkholderiales bacterium]|nr:2-hydroxyacid dehydrogenase [Burkholderiales bacterium]
MKPPLLLASRLPATLQNMLAERYELIGPVLGNFDDAVKELLPADLARITAISTVGAVRITPAGMAALPKLKLISCLGSGYEGVDIAGANARGITVTHSPNCNAASVADLAMGLMIESVRNLPAGRERLKSGAWGGLSAEPNVPLRGLTGRKVGIYGMGAIGLKIALRAAAFEMEIGYFNRKPRSDTPYAYHASLLDLARWCDVLVIAVRAAPENRHAVNREVLAALGNEGHVINISRGSVTDEAALIEALQSGVIAGAGLDVYEHEPKVPEVLFGLRHVALTPHVGGATSEAQRAMEAMVMANLDAFFAGKTPPNPVLL